MKILQINKFHYLRGGADRHYLELSENLKYEGYEVINFSMRHPQNIACAQEGYFAENVALDRFSLKNIFKYFYNYDAVAKLEKLIETEKPDIAHLHNIYHQLTPAIIHVLKRHKIKIVLTLHDYKIICPNYQLFARSQICERCRGGKYYNCAMTKCVKNSRAKSIMATLEAYLYRRIFKSYELVDIFIAPSQFMKNKFVDFGWPAEKIAVLKNFTKPTKEVVVKKKHMLFFDNDYLLYFGRLSDEKGIDILLSAMKLLPEDVKLKIIGKFENSLISRDVENRELNSRVELLGFKSGAELENLICNAKAVVVPSIWYENMPLSVLEAMAAGKVVIASRIGGIPEIIRDGENGLLFEAGNAIDLARKISGLNRADSDAIGARARFGMDEFNWEKYYPRLMTVYREAQKINSF